MIFFQRISKQIMDETSYKSSSDSMSTSGEFEIVSDNGAAAKGMTMEAEDGTKEEEKRGAVVSLPLNLSSPDTASIKTGLLATSPPTLNIANNGDMMDLEQNLKEMIREIEKSPVDSETPSSATPGKNGINSICGRGCSLYNVWCILSIT